MERTSFNIPKESLDFLFSERKECFSQPIALRNDCDLCKTPVMESIENKGMDCVKSDSEESVEYCWCSDCNAEFLNKGELRIHMETHKNALSRNNLREATDSVVSIEEYKLISGEFSLLRSGLCCSRCRKEFKSKKRLVKHILKHDFKCKPRNFECLNSLLKSLKSITPEDNTSLNIRANYSSSPIDSKICDSKGVLVCDSFDSGSSDGTRFLLQGNTSEVDVSMHSHGKATVDSSKGFQLAKSTKTSRLYNSHVESHPSLYVSQKQNISSINDPFIEGDEFQKDEALLRKSVVSTHLSHDPDKHSAIMNEKSSFGKLTNVDGGIVICDYCNKSFTLKFKLREHIVMCHLSIAVHKCFTCHNVFSSESELRTHCAVHTSKSKHICTLCNHNFSSRSDMALHFKEVHNISKQSTCSVCFLGFPTLAELRFHQLCHLYDKKYKCSKCGKAFMNKNYYNSHVRFCQLRTVAYPCEICEKNFLRKQDLENHLHTHGSEKRFSCHLCTKQFRQIGQRDIHIRIVHLKLKPHECGMCKRKFSIRQYLLRHYAVHSDARPFTCDLCGKTFKLKYQLYMHKKRVHSAT